VKEAGVAIAIFGLLCLIIPIGILTITNQPETTMQTEEPQANYLKFWGRFDNGTEVEGWLVVPSNCTNTDVILYVDTLGFDTWIIDWS
jgi:hypothetical protein